MSLEERFRGCWGTISRVSLGFTGWCYREGRELHNNLYKNPFLLCCRAELAFSGAAFPCRKVPAQGVTHTLCSVFLNPRCRNSSSSGPISVPLHLRSCGITFAPKDPPCALKAPGQGKQNNLPSLRLILHPKCYSDNF